MGTGQPASPCLAQRIDHMLFLVIGSLGMTEILCKIFIGHDRILGNGKATFSMTPSLETSSWWT